MSDHQQILNARVNVNVEIQHQYNRLQMLRLERRRLERRLQQLRQRRNIRESGIRDWLLSSRQHGRRQAQTEASTNNVTTTTRATSPATSARASLMRGVLHHSTNRPSVINISQSNTNTRLNTSQSSTPPVNTLSTKIRSSSSTPNNSSSSNASTPSFLSEMSRRQWEQQLEEGADAITRILIERVQNRVLSSLSNEIIHLPTVNTSSTSSTLDSHSGIVTANQVRDVVRNAVQQHLIFYPFQNSNTTPEEATPMQNETPVYINGGKCMSYILISNLQNCCTHLYIHLTHCSGGKQCLDKRTVICLRNNHTLVYCNIIYDVGSE